MLRTLNNVVRTLLIHAAMPPPYWAEALSTVVFLTNRQPSSSKNNGIPYHLLHHKMPDYSILRIFGCLCYPNLSATTHHKLSPRSTACVFLGYPHSQKGYQCLDLSNRKIIISRHVIFDETHFLFAASKPRPDSLDFLIQDILSAPAPSTLAGHTPLLEDTSDPIGLDPAILWYGAAYRLPQGMADENKALIDNDTWRLVPRSPRANVNTGKWVFKHKYHADGSLARHKARWVVRGFSQQYGIDYDETFSPIVKPATIRVVLTIAASRSWPIHQLDVKTTFHHGHLNETVYCQQQPGFIDPAAPDHVCLLQKSLYGLK